MPNVIVQESLKSVHHPTLKENTFNDLIDDCEPRPFKNCELKRKSPVCHVVPKYINGTFFLLGKTKATCDRVRGQASTSNPGSFTISHPEASPRKDRQPWGRDWTGLSLDKNQIKPVTTLQDLVSSDCVKGIQHVSVGQGSIRAVLH